MKRNHLLPLAALAGTAVLSLGLSGCGAESSASASDSVCPDGGINFGVEPFEDPAKLTPAYQTIAKAMSKELDCDVNVQIVDTYSAEVLAMRNDKLTLGQFGPLGYVFAKEKADAEAVASFGTGDGELSTYKAGIWVPEDSPVTSIADLKGKSLALSEPGSTSGDALPRQALKDAGLKESDLKVQYAGGHPEALLALTNGKVDAAEINTQQEATSTEAGQFKAADYREIWTSDPIPNDPITIAGKADPKLKAAVKKALLNLPASAVSTAAGYLDVEPAGQLVAVGEKDYQPLFELAQKLGLTEKDVS
ncbi:phosphonate ABC transporter substrate-binding protein [Marmoricola endophyticus]|uniref:Phosphonate ABC transporter substrate-binding protein n=1 Tax=Marmoricola endophyticus TaxID=2040280 RepID=A0A917BSB5_9ACTN|nr:phosphate/phosphite/phosphonate ABC transporter substrate-binding protein [Marmoricola endophyticus]GGF56919.1 phosphonate ABC transporter substrate-binding protein [Marmoricola endophyticus]